MKKVMTATAILLLAFPVMAEPEQVEAATGRYEIWMGVSGWPGLAGVQPAVAGHFDEVGLGVGVAAHGRLRQFEHSELLGGVDAFIIGNASNVGGVIDNLIARDLYLGTSLKWAFGRARNLQLDAGLGYHLVDMAQVSTRYFGMEHQAWESNRLGGFVGTTWDLGAGREGRTRGLTLAFKVHFVDFGSVRDEDIFLEPVLGLDAGRLDGPIYLLQLGYWAR